MGEAAATLDLRVTDVSGQKAFRASSVPAGATVGELVKGLLARMGLQKNDPNGRAVTWRARLEREGRHLGEGELVGDTLQSDDEISLHPNIDAG